MLTRRIFGSAWLLSAALAAFLVVSPAALTGCGGGGGDKKAGDKDKKKKKPDKPKDQSGKSGDKKSDSGGSVASDDPDLMAKEEIKDTFKGVYEEYMQGNAGLDQLVTAIKQAEESLTKLNRTSWNDKFETDPGMLNDAKVEVAHKYDIPSAKSWALDNLENVQEGIARLEAIREMMNKIPRAKLVKTEMVDNRAIYDEALQNIERAVAEVQNLSALVKRTPPSGEVNLLDMDKDLWSADKTMDWTIAMGAMNLEGKDKFQMITAMHHYLKDFRLRLGFTIAQGSFDIQLRSLPGKASTMKMTISREDFPGSASITIVVQGNNIRFEDPEGNILDEFSSDKAPAGGGISFILRQGASVNITDLTLEAIE